MSRHPIDRLALLAGLSLALLGVIGLIDDSGLIRGIDAWVGITFLLLVGLVGVVFSIAGLRQTCSVEAEQPGAVVPEHFG